MRPTVLAAAAAQEAERDRNETAPYHATAALLSGPRRERRALGRRSAGVCLEAGAPARGRQRIALWNGQLRRCPCLDADLGGSNWKKPRFSVRLQNGNRPFRRADAG